MPIFATAAFVATMSSAQGVAWPMPTNLAPTRWTILGPFPSPAKPGGGREGFARDFLSGEATAQVKPGTKVTVDGTVYETRAATADRNGAVNFLAVFGKDAASLEMRTAYAYAEWNAPRSERLAVRFGSDDGAKVWLNGRPVHTIQVDRGLDPDQDRFEMDVVKGTNRLLVKVDNGSGDWGFALRAFDAKGQQALAALQVRRNLESLDPGPADGGFFLGESFPRIVWRKADAARSIFGDAPIRTRWFGPEGKETSRPQSTGRYAALVEAKTRDGFVHRQFLAFAKLPPGIDPRIPAPPFNEPARLTVPADALPGFPLNPANQGEMSRHLWLALQDYIQRHPNAATLVATLMENAGKTGTPHWLDSGFIRDAEYQLGIRMRLEDRTPRPLAPPAPLATPAPVLRSGSEAEAGVAPGTVDRLREVCREWVKDDPNGFVVLVARKGVAFMHEGFGGYHQESTFYPASIGKSIAGLTFARAVDQGLVSFDEPLGDTMPNWKGGPFDRVTYRHCFYHLTDLGGHASHGGLFNAYLDEALQGQDARFGTPGERHRYNGDGYNLAGKALELKTGQSFVRLMHEGLQAPFGESVTQFDNGFGDRFTARYLGKVGQMILQDGKYGSYQLFRPGFVKTLFPSRVTDRVPGFPDRNLEWGIGLTWMPDVVAPGGEPELGTKVVGHGSASASVWRVAPEHDLVVVIGRDAHKDYAQTGVWAAKFMRVLKAGLPR